MNRIGLLVPLLLLAAACDRRDAPADEVVRTAEQIADLEEPEPRPMAEGPYAPRDTCGKVKGSGTFRRELARSVRNRDTDALVALAASDIKLDSGGGSGAEELRRRLDDPERQLWAELDELLALGCSANRQGGITIPWYFDQDIKSVNAARGMIVTGERVPLLAAPGSDAEQLGTISWGAVEVVNFEPEQPFLEVKAPGGEQGFIATDQLRSLLDYRLRASSRNGKWSITSFVAGD